MIQLMLKNMGLFNDDQRDKYKSWEENLEKCENRPLSLDDKQFEVRRSPGNISKPLLVENL